MFDYLILAMQLFSLIAFVAFVRTFYDERDISNQ